MAMPYKELEFLHCYLILSYFLPYSSEGKDGKKHVYNHETKPPKINV